jgi:hypothetical protein
MAGEDLGFADVVAWVAAVDGAAVVAVEPPPEEHPAAPATRRATRIAVRAFPLTTHLPQRWK